MFLSETSYWILPKPADLGIVLADALEARRAFGGPFDVAALERNNAWHPGLSVLASLVFAVVILAAAAREFVTSDY
jgi:hypothetical protein